MEIISLLFWAILLPLDRILVVYFPSAIINALNTNKKFINIVTIALSFEIILMIIPMLEDIYNMLIRDILKPRINMNIKKEVYLQALKTDYKYINNPEYYDYYTWAVNEYANKASDAFGLINQFFSALMIIIALITIISTTGAWVILITFISITLRTFAFMQINKLDIKKEDEFIPKDRWLNYLHRIFYLNQYAADLKSTNLRKYILRDYDKLKEEKIDIIKKYSYKTVKWSLLADLIYRVSEFIIVI